MLQINQKHIVTNQLQGFSRSVVLNYIEAKISPYTTLSFIPHSHDADAQKQDENSSLHRCDAAHLSS